jgi:Phosphotransferase enzyme family
VKLTEVAALHADTCDLSHPGSPSATVAILREQPEAVDCLVLGDTSILIEEPTGIRVITDDRLEHVAAVQHRAMHEHATGSVDHDRRFAELATEQRRYPTIRTASGLPAPDRVLRPESFALVDGPPVAPPRPSIDNLVWCEGCTAWRVRAAGKGEGKATMQASEVRRAVAAAMSTAASLGLTVDDAIVLHDSNKLTLRLLPCDALARVAPVAHQVAQFEVELAQRLAESGSPVAALEPRVEPCVYGRDGFVVTLWTYYEPVTSREISPADYANALGRLHAGMRKLDVPTPHFTDRVDQAQQLVASRDHTPALADADRELLANTLRSLRRVIGERGGAEQHLHGEPHPGNLLTTKNGLVFIDLETCCRGPVEFDLAHAPQEVSEHYLGVNQDLLRECRILVLAMITTWRWDRGDQLPNGRQLGTEWLTQIRAALDRNGLDPHG